MRTRGPEIVDGGGEVAAVRAAHGRGVVEVEVGVLPAVGDAPGGERAAEEETLAANLLVGARAGDGVG